MADPRYPAGRFDGRTSLSSAERGLMIDQIASTPAAMCTAVGDLSPAQLSTPYRDGGWTIRQVVHHVPDSHLNAYIRFKLALTEDCPTIKAYDEAAWAALPDSQATPVETSLLLLDSLHARWVTLLRAMRAADFERTLNHPDNGLMTLDMMLGLYAWHGRHHVAHITSVVFAS